MNFPDYRARRMRRSEGLRRLVRETRLAVDQLIYPLFVAPGAGAVYSPSLPDLALLAALALVALSVLKTGDEVLIPDNAYGPNKALADGELRHFGITHRFYEPMDPQDLSRQITPNTRLVWLEAPVSVRMEFPDLPEMVRRCRERWSL